MPPGTLNNVSTFEDLLPTNDVVWDDVDDAADVRCFFLVFVAAAAVVVVVEEEEEEEEEEEAAAVGARLFCFCRFFVLRVAVHRALPTTRIQIGLSRDANKWLTCGQLGQQMPF